MCIRDRLGAAFDKMFLELDTYLDNLAREQNARRLAEQNALQSLSLIHI